MIPRTEAELSAQLRALAVDPPDDGFAQRLSERLQECGHGSERRAKLVRFPGKPVRANHRLVLLLAAAAVFVAGGAAAVVGPATVTRWIASWTEDKAPGLQGQQDERRSRSALGAAGSTKTAPRAASPVVVPRVEAPSWPAVSEIGAPPAPQDPQLGVGRQLSASPSVAASPVAPQRALVHRPRRKVSVRSRRRIEQPPAHGPAAPSSGEGKPAERLHVPRVRLSAPNRGRVAPDSSNPTAMDRGAARVRPPRPGPAASRVEPETERSRRAGRDARRLREQRLERRARRREQRQLRRQQRRRARPAPRVPR